MNEDTTKDLPGSRSFEERVFALFERVFAELADIRQRQDRLEMKHDRLEMKHDQLAADVVQLTARINEIDEKVDRRLQETRPIWEAVLAEVKEIKVEVRRINVKIDAMNKNQLEHRTDINILDERITNLEERA